MLSSASASAAPADRRRPLVLVAPAKGGARITALNMAARRGGLTEGELLSNARSKVLNLEVRDADPAADAAALRRLALWCLRYAPVVAPWDERSGADGLFIDITGCAHLLGGEERLLADLEARLRAFGLSPRSAIAGTAGAAWGLARHGEGERSIVAPGGERAALQDLPLAALRLSPAAQQLMRRLGLRCIGEVMDQPRAPFAARFQPELLLRLDQALGRAPEPLVPVVAPPLYRTQAAFAEPIMTHEHVLEAARRLLKTLTEELARAAVGARLVRLLLFQVDGETLSLDLGLAAPSRDAKHIAQLIGLRLYRLGNEFATDFGFEAAAVDVLAAESLPERQERLAVAADESPPEELARLVDRLQQHLGVGAVRCLQPVQSHTPERAVRARSPSPRRNGVRPLASDVGIKQDGRREGSDPLRAVAAPHPSPLPTEEWGEGTPSAARPLLLLERPEPADVLAVVPDGPPRQFRWRGVLHQVAGADGPERITPEWWRRTGEETRDYYVVEDAEGRRFWLFRAGLYGRPGAPPQWYVHGMLG
jgi:protein ImuB